MDFVFLQGRPTDPRKKTDASDDLPPWSCMPTNAATVEVALQNQDSASSIAAWRKRDEKGTVLIEVAKSEAGHGVPETDDVEKAVHNAASSSSRPAKEWFFFIRGLHFFWTIKSKAHQTSYSLKVNALMLIFLVYV